MRIFDAIVEPLVLVMLEFPAHVLACRAIGSEPVRDQNARDTSLFADELGQEPLGGTPGPVFLAVDRADDLVKMPFPPN